MEQAAHWLRETGATVSEVAYGSTRLLLAFTIVVLAACSGDSPADPDDDGRVVEANPSFAADIQEIFDRRGCSSSTCHGAAQQGGMDLREGAAYGSIVGVTATSEPIVRVIPGDPEGSYVVMRLEGRQTTGSRMPLGGAPLDAIDLTNLRNWIANGAPSN